MDGPVAATRAATGTETEARPSSTELAARLRLVVGRLNRRIRIDGRESVPPLQLSAMVTVEEHGPLRLSELARREAVSVPTMSRVLAALDEQGLVVRTPDPQDARGVLVTLSERGRAAAGGGAQPPHGAGGAAAGPAGRGAAGVAGGGAAGAGGVAGRRGPDQRGADPVAARRGRAPGASADDPRRRLRDGPADGHHRRCTPRRSVLPAHGASRRGGHAR